MENSISNNDYSQIERLWDASYNIEQNDWSIKEYKAPPLNINCVKQKKEREQKEFFDQVLLRKEHYPKAEEKYDNKGNLIIPERGSFFDEMIKKKDFGYSDENKEKIKQKHINHKRTFNDTVNIIDVVEVNNDKNKAPLYRDIRQTIFDEIEKNIKKSEKIYPFKADMVKKLKEEIEKEKSSSIKEISEIIKKKYEKRGSIP